MTQYLYDTITGTYDDPHDNFEKTIASQLDRLKPVKDWLTNFWDPYHASGGGLDTKDFSTVPDELDQERTIKLQALIALAREVHNQYSAHENHFKSGLKTSIDNLDRCWQGTPTKNVNRVLIKIQDRNTVHTSAIAQLEQRLNAVPDTIINAVTEKVDVVLGGTSEGRIYPGNTTAKAVVNFSKLEGQPDHCHYRKDGNTAKIPLKECKDLVNAANSNAYDLTFRSRHASPGCFHETDIAKVAKSPEAVGYLRTILKYYKIFHGSNHGTDNTVPAASDKPHILPAHHGGSASGHHHGHFPGKHTHEAEYNTSKLLEFNKDVIAQFRHNYEEIANTCIDADEICAERITDSINKAADAAQNIDIDQEITDPRLPRCYGHCGGECICHGDHSRDHTTDLHTFTPRHQEGEHTPPVGTGPGAKPEGGGTHSDVDVDKILSAISALRNNGSNGQPAQGGGAGGAAGGGSGGGPSGSGGSANIPAIPGPYQFDGGDPPESVGRPHHRISHYHGGRRVSDDAEHIDEQQDTPPVTTDTTPATDETPPEQQDTPVSTTSSPVEGITIERHSVGVNDDSPEPVQPEQVPDETGDEEWTAD